MCVQQAMHLCLTTYLPVGTPDLSTHAGAHEEETPPARCGSAEHKDQMAQYIPVSQDLSGQGLRNSAMLRMPSAAC